MSSHQIEKLIQGMRQLYQNTASLALLTKASHYDRKAKIMEIEQANMKQVNQKVHELSSENKRFVRNLRQKKQNDTILSYFIVVALAVIVALLMYRRADLEEKSQVVREEIHTLVQVLRKHNNIMMLLPVEVTMINFSKYKDNNSYWNSVPFYTHLEGYKLFLKVYANGSYDGIAKNTHVSVFITIMQGEFDYQLKWPFKGEFDISLLNQGDNNGHLTRTIHFNDTVPDDIMNRKKERDVESLISGVDREYQNSFIIVTYSQNIFKIIALSYTSKQKFTMDRNYYCEKLSFSS